MKSSDIRSAEFVSTITVNVYIEKTASVPLLSSKAFDFHFSEAFFDLISAQRDQRKGESLKVLLLYQLLRKKINLTT